jgi:hypothetical protein
MTVSVPGFKTFVRQNIQVQVAQTLRLDVTMEVGATTESVTVTDAAPLLKTESGELSTNVSTDKLNALPVLTLGSGTGLGNVRNPLQVVNVMPGTMFSNDNTLRVNGMPSSTYAIRIEGQDATNGIHRQFSQVNQASVDAIQEVSVQTSNFAAEFGQAGGGYFNYTMKSGTNKYHGTAYDYFVNEALSAGTPFTAGTGDRANQHLRNTQRRNDYGFSFGGPIQIPRLYDGHDKSFFFFNFEQFRENQNFTTGLFTVPTPAYRLGDFSGASTGLADLTAGGQLARDPLGQVFTQNGIYDPRSQQVVNGSNVRSLFPGNVIPAARFDRSAKIIQDMIPLPNGALANQAINNYAVPAYNNFRHTTIPGFKLDHTISTNIKLAWYYSETRTVSPQANGYTQPFTSAWNQDNVSRTTRVNYDHTLSPTVLLHLGAGLLHTNQVLLTPEVDQVKQLGFEKAFTYNKAFPWMNWAPNAARGGFSLPGANAGQAFIYEYFKDIKPTFNAYLTSVRGNHTVKMGGEAMFEGFPVQSWSRAHGNIGFTAQQTANPAEDGRGLNASTGFGYASFLLGSTSSVQHSAGANGRLGNHTFGFYIQDTWKVTRKMTLDYGLRYDYVTLLTEQYGRMQSAAFNLPNPVANNRNGTVIYEGNCKCKYNSNYPHAWGPRLGMAYQLTSKTVLRAGIGFMYGTAPNQANLGYSIGDFYSISPVGYGAAATQLQDGNPYAPGNKFGNQPIFWPDFRPSYPNEVAPGVRPPNSPFVAVDRNSGRPPRILQWSIGIQKEVMRDLVVEASYVGNRGVWWTAPLLAGQNYNGNTPESLQRLYGLNIRNATDRALLNAPISSPAVIARFPALANPNFVYPGFPLAQPLKQAIRPIPQWFGSAPFLGPPLGVTWYDSLQAKVTKRMSHGLTVDTAFTWQKELNLGVSSDTTYLTPAPNLINDVFNYKTAKQISGFSRPFMLVVAFTYVTPGMGGDGRTMKALSWATRDWTLGGVLRYQSGEAIRVPPSNNALLNQLTLDQNPASFGGGRTFWNRVDGQPLFLVDPNSDHEPGRLDRCGTGRIRRLRALLQQLPLAAAAVGIDEHRPRVRDEPRPRRQSLGPRGMAERDEPPIPLQPDAGPRRWFRRAAPQPGHAHGAQHAGSAVTRLRLHQHLQRRRGPAP